MIVLTLALYAIVAATIYALASGLLCLCWGQFAPALGVDALSWWQSFCLLVAVSVFRIKIGEAK